jgi:tetratricopeptide (TPR) repeat protein
MSESGKAVFLSYASQDAEAAKRIADALRAAGVEVWFDQNELVGGDAWDQKIRRQIGSCALLVPIISASTQARREGYFRLEWRLAVERMRQMDDDLPFLLPVVIDGTKDSEAFVPDRFRETQWTRLSGGETPPAFVARVKKLLSGGHGPGIAETASRQPPTTNRQPASNNRRPSRLWWALPIFGVAMALLLVVNERRKDAPPPTAVEKVGATAPNAVSTASLDPKVAEARALVAKARPLHEDLDSNTRTDYELAEQLFKRALELAPLDAEVWANYSWFCNNYYGVGLDRTPTRLAESQQAADRAMKLDPNLDMVRFAWANFYRREPAKSDDALRILRELVHRQPDNGPFGRVLALTLSGQNKAAEALAVIDDIIARGVVDSRLWTARARLLSDLERPASEVEEAIDRSLAIKPAPRVLVRKAMSLMEAHGDLPAAAAIIARVPVDFWQEDRMVAVAATLALAQRQTARCREILARFPRDYLEEGNFQEFNWPKAMLAGYADWLDGKRDLARIEWAEALQVVEQRLASRRTDPRLHYLKTVLHAMLGQEKEAEAAFRVHAQITPANNVSLRTQLDYWLGAPEKALAALETWQFTPTSIAWLHSNPIWVPFWGNPRFEALKANAPDPSAASPTPAGAAASKSDEKSVAVRQATEAERLVARARTLYEPWDLASREDIKLADQLLHKAVALEPENGEAWAHLALVACAINTALRDTSQGNIDAARTAAERAIRLAPDSDAARAARAYSLRFNQRTKAEAERLLQIETERQPNNRLMWRTLGSLLNSRGEREKALHCYEQAAALPGGDPIAHFMRGSVFYGLQRYAKAEVAFDQALALAPRYSRPLAYKLTLSLDFRGDLATARRLAESAPAELFEDPGGAIAAANVWLYAGKPGQCRDALQQCPDYVRITNIATPKNLITGHAYWAAGSTEAAKSEWRVALHVVEKRLLDEPNAPDLLFNQVLLLTLLGETAEVSQRMPEVLQRAKAGEIGTYQMAELHAALHQVDKAFQLLDRIGTTVKNVGRFGDLRFGPIWEPLRSDPRFQVILDRARMTADEEKPTAKPPGGTP